MSAREDYLRALGVPADGDTLAGGAPLALDEQEIDEHLIPVADIVFTPDMVEGFDLETQFTTASRVLFERFRSPRRDKQRHSLLHGRISAFLGGLRLERRTGGFVKQRVRAGRVERDLAQVLATSGGTPAQLVALLSDLISEETR